MLWRYIDFRFHTSFEMASEFNATPSNDSNDFDFEIKFHLPLFKVMTLIFCGLITLIGVVGNIMVIVVIYRRKSIHNTVDIAMSSLAVCDLLFVATFVPFLAYHHAADGWLPSDVFCKLFPYLLHVTVYMTAYILVLVSILRYLIIVHGAATAKYRTKRNIILCLVVLAVVIFIANCPVIMVYQKRSVSSITGRKRHKCSVTSNDIGEQLYLVYFVFSYLVPLATISSFYTAIWCHLKQHQSHMMTIQSHPRRGHRLSIKESTVRATRIIIIVVLGFGICWLPFHVHMLVGIFKVRPKSGAIFSVIARFLAYSNFCINPIIYNLASNDFRKEFRRLCHFSSRWTHAMDKLGLETAGTK